MVGPILSDLVTRLQAIISEEIKKQMDGLPTHVIACVGGGSNAIGAFYHFWKMKPLNLLALRQVV